MAINYGHVLALGFCMMLMGCTRSEPPVSSEKEPYVVASRDVEEVCREDGVLSAAKSIAIYPETSTERLLEVPVGEGDVVEKGQVLFRYDSRRLEESVEEAKANLESARLRSEVLARRHRADRLEASQALVRAEQALEAQRRSAEMQRRLAAEGLASTSAVTAAESELRIAELALQAARQQAEGFGEQTTSSESASLEASILQQEHQLQRLEKRLEQCVGRAPFAGRVVRIHDLVRPLVNSLDEIKTPLVLGGGPLMTVADTSRMRVTGQFFESDIARIRPGQRVRVSVPHVPGRAFEGEVKSIGQEGQSQGHTATVPVDVEVDNPDGLLRPGLSAELGIVVGESKGVVAAPVEFLRRRGEDTFVLRYVGAGGPEEVPVELGLSDGRFIEVRSGLEVGDTIVME